MGGTARGRAGGAVLGGAGRRGSVLQGGSALGGALPTALRHGAGPTRWAPALALGAAFLLPLLGGARFASHKSAGSAKNGRDSPGKHLGIKIFHTERCEPGSIVVRQRGTKWRPGHNIHVGRDHTLHALVKGKVYFTKTRVRGRARTIANVLPEGKLLVYCKEGGKYQDPQVVDKAEYFMTHEHKPRPLPVPGQLPPKRARSIDKVIY